MIWCVRVVVPALEQNCVASRVLATEGVPHEVHIMASDTDYADLVADCWESGYGFVIVEHDSCPWLGAIDQITACVQPWCSFYYAREGGKTRSLGCVKFADNLVQFSPQLAKGWRGTHWRELDGVVLRAVSKRLTEAGHRYPVCVHRPGIGHARG